MRLRNIIIIPLLSLCISVVAQRIEGYYVSKSSEKCTTYYLLPQKVFESSQHGELEHDITLLVGVDSATLNFTYISEKAQKIDSVKIKSKVVDYNGAAKRIYIEPSSSNKKYWVHRYGITVDFQSLQNLYEVDAAPMFTIYASGEAIDFEVNQRKWRRYAPVGKRIIDMIKLNN
ncbi:MAG: hypothetical protein SNH28_08685 [Rikenellaceae bacterium]